MVFDPKFICCPGAWIKGVHYPCGEVIHITRVGVAGKKGTPDSKLFQCEACGTYFTSEGETWREAHGRLE